MFISKSLFLFLSFYLILLFFPLTNANTIDGLVKEANDATQSAEAVKNAVKLVNDEIGNYQTTVNGLVTPTAADRAGAAKTSAAAAIVEGKKFTQNAYDAQHKAEDALLEVDALLEAINEAKAAASPVDTKLTAAETTANAAKDSISTELSSAKGHVKTFQTDTDRARKAFYAADLVKEPVSAIAQLTKDVALLTTSPPLSTETAAAKQKSDEVMKAANALNAQVTQQQLAEAKESCDKALDTARKLKISAEDQKSQATEISAASAAAAIFTGVPSTSQEQEAKAAETAARAAILLFDGLLADTTGDIFFALRDAAEGKKKVAELLAKSDKSPPPVDNSQAGTKTTGGDPSKPADDQKSGNENSKTVDADKAKAEQEKEKSDQEKKEAEQKKKEAEQKEKELEETKKRAQQAEEENRRLTQQLQDADKQAANEVKLPLDQNGNPINIAHYIDEQYQQPADGDSDPNCLNRLFDCDKPEMLAMCAGTCSREINNQDHGQNCDSMADLCNNTIYTDMMKVYCKGTCR